MDLLLEHNKKQMLPEQAHMVRADIVLVLEYNLPPPTWPARKSLPGHVGRGTSIYQGCRYRALHTIGI